MAAEEVSPQQRGSFSLVSQNGAAEDTSRRAEHPGPEFPRFGLVNGLGAARQGLTEGLTNGLGFTDGLGGRRFRGEARRRRGRLLLISAVAFALLAPALLLPPDSEASLGGIPIDGRFGEWRVIPGYAQTSTSENPDVDLRATKVFLQHDRLSVYAAVRGRAFGDFRDLDVLYTFLDGDGKAGTGYDEGRLGADLLVELQGWNGTVTSAKVWQWSDLPDRNDWSGWAELPWRVLAAAHGGEVEWQVDLSDWDRFDLARASLSLFFDDQEGNRSTTALLAGPTYGALELRVASVGDRVPQAKTAPLLIVTFRAIGTAVNVANLVVGPATVSGFTPLYLGPGETLIERLTIDSSILPRGTLVTAEVRGVTADRPVTIIGGPVRAYVGSSPPGKVIDGLFGDWGALIRDPSGAPNPNVDIVGHAAEVQNGTTFLLLDVRGRALGGDLVPVVRVRPEPGPAAPPGGPSPPERRAGEDIVRVFYDTNATDGGFPFGNMTADALLEIRGRNGRAREVHAFAWRDRWVLRGAAQAVAAGSRLEASLAIPGMELGGARYLTVVRDWQENADATSAEVVGGTRSLPDGIEFAGSYEMVLPKTADGWVRFGVRGQTLATEAAETRGDPGLVPLHGGGALTAVAKPLTNIPTVDGNCGTLGNEYLGSDTKSNANLKFFVGRRSELSRLYVCVEVTADTTNNGTADWGELLFDRNHDGGAKPLTDDRRFRIPSGGPLQSDKGTGNSWTSCGGSCSLPVAVGAFNNSREVYEFGMSFWDVWGTNSTSPGQVAGFAIVANDNTGPATYTWGNNNVDELKPNSWGHLQIAEFRDVVPVAAGILSLLVLWRPRGCPSPDRRRLFRRVDKVSRPGAVAQRSRPEQGAVAVESVEPARRPR